MATAPVELDVLGPSAARVGDVPVALGARRLRSLLGLLVLHRDRSVPAERIIDVLWEGSPPRGAGNTLQGYVASLRRLLEPERRPRAASAVLLHEASGYRFAVRPEQVDAARFEATARAARDRVLQGLPDPMRPPLLPAGPDAEAAEDQQEELVTALRLWHGDAYADLGDLPAAAAERRRLDQLRLDARVAGAVIDLSLGRPASAAATLEEMAGEHPLREQLWGLWAVALVRDGRQAEALAVLGGLRSTLADELGIDPGAAVVELHTDVLRQDPTVLGLTRAAAAREAGWAHRPRRTGRADLVPTLRSAVALDAVQALRDAVAGTGRTVVVLDGPEVGTCTHDACCHAPVVVVVVPDEVDHPGQVGPRADAVRRATGRRDLAVIDPVQRSPFRDGRSGLERTFPA